MVLPTAFLIHSCTVRRKCRNYSLGYDTGTAAFTVGKTLTGATSHATAIIAAVTGDATSGTFTLHTISGTFQNNEAISDNGTVPGAALVNGTAADSLDSYGQISFTDVDTVVSCRFVSPRETMRMGNKSVPFIAATPRALFPSGTTVAEKDLLISTTTGFSETYQVNSVSQVYEAAVATVSHIACEIAAVV